MNSTTRKLSLMVAMIAGLSLAGCVTQPYNNGRNYDAGYQGQRTNYDNGHSSRGNRCQSCGVVQQVQQVYLDGSHNGGTLGAIIGAVAGGVLGSTVGKGDGRTAATVGGAVAGGFVGNQVGKRNDGRDAAWRIVVRLDNGQYATVTQREDPGVRNGDYVEVRGDHVYVR